MRSILVLAALLAASSVRAEEFQCKSSHPRIWGTLTIHTDRKARSVEIAGDLLPGARLLFVDGATGRVERGTSTQNDFGSAVVAQLVRFHQQSVTVGWRDHKGKIAYLGTATPADGNCRYKSSYFRL